MGGRGPVGLQGLHTCRLVAFRALAALPAEVLVESHVIDCLFEAAHCVSLTSVSIVRRHRTPADGWRVGVLARGPRYPANVAERSAGWRQGPDGRWYPPVNDRDDPARAADRSQLAELAVLVNSGVLTAEIDEAVDDPELAV